MGYSPCGSKESDTTECLTLNLHESLIDKKKISIVKQSIFLVCEGDILVPRSVLLR